MPLDKVFERQGSSVIQINEQMWLLNFVRQRNILTFFICKAGLSIKQTRFLNEFAYGKVHLLFAIFMKKSCSSFPRDNGGLPTNCIE